MRFTRTLAAVLAATLLAAVLLGCGGAKTDTPTTTATEPATETTPTQAASLPALRVGTLQTDDLLPLWVAQQEGLLQQAGLNVEIITFQSAQEEIAALTAGEIDAMMTDMVVTALLNASGTPARAVTVMLGTPAGIVANKKSGITSLSKLAGVPVGASSPTVIEFLVDKALADAGVAQDKIKIEEIKKLPVRFEMLTAGKLKAAGLPWTLMELARLQGETVLLDRDAAAKYTSTVLVFSQSFIDGTKISGGSTSSPAETAAAIKALLGAWDSAVEKINAAPDSYRTLLVEKAKLPEPLKDTYPIQQYPTTHLPEQAQFDDVLTWMQDKSYLKEPLTYDMLVFDASAQ